MRAFVAGRAGGKTHAGFEHLRSAGGGVMFVSSRQMVKWCEEKFGMQGAHGVEFVAWNDQERFRDRLRGRGYMPNRVILDDLDWFLREHFGTVIDVVTFNGNRNESVLPENEHENWMKLTAQLPADNPFLIDGDW